MSGVIHPLFYNPTWHLKGQPDCFYLKGAQFLIKWGIIFSLTNSVEQSPAWETNGLSASQKTPPILWNFMQLQEPDICPYSKPDGSSPCSHPISWRLILIVSSHLLLGLPSCLSPSSFRTKTLHAPLLVSKLSTCPAHLTPLDRAPE